MAGKEIYIITVRIQLGTNGKGGCGEGEREVKSEKLAALHSRHKEISSANSALARLPSYVYDKAENKSLITVLNSSLDSNTTAREVSVGRQPGVFRQTCLA